MDRGSSTVAIVTDSARVLSKLISARKRDLRVSILSPLQLRPHDGTMATIKAIEARSVFHTSSILSTPPNQAFSVLGSSNPVRPGHCRP